MFSVRLENEGMTLLCPVLFTVTLFWLISLNSVLFKVRSMKRLQFLGLDCKVWTASLRVTVFLYFFHHVGLRSSPTLRDQTGSPLRLGSLSKENWPRQFSALSRTAVSCSSVQSEPWRQQLVNNNSWRFFINQTRESYLRSRPRFRVRVVSVSQAKTFLPRNTRQT